MKALISIIIPCYNQAQFLDAALQSVLDQTYTNWECIIVDDGSPDNTAEVVQKWVAKDSRFIYLYKANGGVSSSRNLAIDKAKGDYIQFLDSDDFIDNRKLELSLNKIAMDNTIELVVSDFRMFVDNPKITSKPYCNLKKEFLNFESLLYHWNASFSIPIHCGFFKTSLFKSIRFPEDMTAQEDWIVWVSIFDAGCKAVFLDDVLAFYRTNPLSRTNSKSMYKDQLKAVAYFSNILSPAAFNQLLVVLISRYYKKNDALILQLQAVKKSNSYQTGLMIKKILKTLGVLRLFKHFVPFLLKFKSK